MCLPPWHSLRERKRGFDKLQKKLNGIRITQISGILANPFEHYTLNIMTIFNCFIREDLLPPICVMTSTLVIGNWSKVGNQTIIYKRRQSGDCQSLCQRHLDVLVKRLYLDVPTHLAKCLVVVGSFTGKKKGRRRRRRKEPSRDLEAFFIPLCGSRALHH